MREASEFGVRTQSAFEKEPLKKYFLVFEGQKTEFLYFKAINEMKLNIGINPLVELVHIERSYYEAGWSNPKIIVNQLSNDLDESKHNCISFTRLFNKVIDYFVSNKKISDNRALFNRVRYEFDKFRCKQFGVPECCDVSDVEKACGELLNIINRIYDLKYVIDNFSEILNYGEITYDFNVDEMCVIVDRDSKSFISKTGNNQYQYVLEECNEKNFNLYVTNPCFEFWLLLHLVAANTIDKNSMLLNPLGHGKRTYAENELRNIFSTYSKDNFDARHFVSKVDVAINNARCFCEDINGLEKEVGSNLGLLIERMRQ